MSQITVLGASGFVGSHLVRKLKDLNLGCYSPDREEKLPRRNLGHVIYCIGLTGDFRSRPFDTVEAHVCKLREVLVHCEFDSLLYLSSARLYGGGLQTNEEAKICVNPLRPNDLYNISKAMGEALVFSSDKRTRVVRLSNVYGDDFTSDNFLSAIIRDAVLRKKIVLRTSFDSEKDYISISDVVDILIRIATNGRGRIYNLASGRNTSNFDLSETVKSLTGCEVEVAAGAKRVAFPKMNIKRIKEEFDFTPLSVLHEMKHIIELFGRRFGERE